MLMWAKLSCKGRADARAINLFPDMLVVMLVTNGPVQPKPTIYVAFKASHKDVEIFPQLNVKPPMTYIFQPTNHKQG